MEPLEGYQVEAEAGHAVALSLEVDDELRAEGLAREIVHAVQNARREAGLEVSDRIELSLGGDDELLGAARAHEAYITGETLATSVSYDGDSAGEKTTVEGRELLISRQPRRPGVGLGMELGSDTKAVLLAAGLIFILALSLGVWKYRQMARSSDGLAHPYVDTAHRAALLYSFATLLVATFVELSGWSTAVNLIAAFVVILFFVAAIVSYIAHGLLRDTDNQFREGEEPPGLHQFMWALIVAEIAGFSVLLAGFVDSQII